MVSNNEIIQSTDNSTSVQSTQPPLTIFGQLSLNSRLVYSHSILMFAAFIIILAIYIASSLLSSLFFCKKKSHYLTSKDYIDQLGYEDLMNEYIETKNEIEALGASYPDLTNILNTKLEKLGNALKRIFKHHDFVELARLDPKEINIEELKTFYQAHEVALSKRGLQGLYTYRMMVNLKS